MIVKEILARLRVVAGLARYSYEQRDGPTPERSDGQNNEGDFDDIREFFKSICTDWHSAIFPTTNQLSIHNGYEAVHDCEGKERCKDPIRHDDVRRSETE